MRPGERPPPRFLIDRALGVQLKVAIQERGFEVVTLRDLYGEEGAQNTDDITWIQEAVAAGRLYLTKDDSIRRNKLEQDAMREANGRLFCLPNGHVATDEMRERFLHNLNRIIQRGRQDGPFAYGVYPDSLVRLWPDPTPLPATRRQRRRFRR